MLPFSSSHLPQVCFEQQRCHSLVCASPHLAHKAGESAGIPLGTLTQVLPSSLKKPTRGHSGCALHPNRKVLCNDSTWGKQTRSWKQNCSNVCSRGKGCCLRSTGSTCPCTFSPGWAEAPPHTQLGRDVQAASLLQGKLLLLLSQTAELLPAGRKVKPQHSHGGAGEGTSQVLLLLSGS